MGACMAGAYVQRPAFQAKFYSILLPGPNGFLPHSAAAPKAGKASKADSSSSPENQFIRAVIDLHDKYMEYVQVRSSHAFEFEYV